MNDWVEKVASLAKENNWIVATFEVCPLCENKEALFTKVISVNTKVRVSGDLYFGILTFICTSCSEDMDKTEVITKINSLLETDKVRFFF